MPKKGHGGNLRIKPSQSKNESCILSDKSLAMVPHNQRHPSTTATETASAVLTLILKMDGNDSGCSDGLEPE